MTHERRITDTMCWDASLVMGCAYTAIYALMVVLFMLVAIPDENKTTVDILAGAMTVIQTSIVNRFFGGSKSADDAQKLIAQSKERTDSVLREVVSSSVPATNGATKLKADDDPVPVKVVAAVPVPVKETPDKS